MKQKITEFIQQHWFPIILSLGLSIGFILLFSHSTSPSSWYYNGNHTSVSITIARGWHFDIIPYKDLFATNGPWMYWLGSIGVGLGNGNKGGIIIPQIINLFTFLLSIYATSQLVTNNKWYSCMTIVLTTCLLKINYPDGMYAQEFLLPWIGWSYYCIAHYFKTNTMHWYDACMYGCSIGVILMCDPKAIYVLLPMIFVYTKQCIANFKKAILYLGITLCSVAVIVVPFVLYFLSQGCLQDFFYNTFIYQENTSLSTYANPYFYKQLFLLRFPIFAMCFASLLLLIQKKYTEAISWGMLGCIELFIFLHTDLTSVYSLHLVSNIVILCNAIFVLFCKHQKVVSIFSACISCIALFLLYINDFSQAIHYTQVYSMYMNQGWEGLVEKIPSDEYDAFVVYGNDNMQNTYLLTNAMPCYKYFYSQEKIAKTDETIKQDIVSTFQSSKAKWILTGSQHGLIDSILDENYTIYESSSAYTLYQNNKYPPAKPEVFQFRA